MYYLCEKYCKPIIVQYYVADCINWVFWLTLGGLMDKLVLGTCSQNGTHSNAGDLLYSGMVLSPSLD